MDDDIGGVCLVTQPERGAEGSGKSHAHDLADIVAELTTVAVLTANLPGDSDLADAHETVVYSTSGAGENVVVEALRFLRNQIRLCLALRRRDERVVLFFGTTSYLLPVLAARLLGKQVLILPRGDVPYSLRLRWEESLPDFVARGLAALVSGLEHANYHLAHAIAAYTPSMATELGLDRYAEKLHPHGARFVDTDRFDVTTPFEDREPTVGFVGRLDVEKRIPQLADAASRLPDDVRFVFVGDGDYRDQLEADLVDDIDAGRVEVTGWVDREEVPAQLNRLQLLVMPSEPTEGLPTAILEGMACGTPALATPVSGVPDVVRDGETGFLLETIDGEEIAADIERILHEETLAEKSAAARSLVESEYSFEAAVERYRSILGALS